MTKEKQGWPYKNPNMPKNYIYGVDVKFAFCADIDVYDIEADTREEAKKLAIQEAHLRYPHRKIKYARPNYRESNFLSESATGIYLKGK
jgi:hypothetical protein